jgi:hypothetical protein
MDNCRLKPEAGGRIHLRSDTGIKSPEAMTRPASWQDEVTPTALLNARQCRTDLWPCQVAVAQVLLGNQSELDSGLGTAGRCLKNLSLLNH